MSTSNNSRLKLIGVIALVALALGGMSVEAYKTFAPQNQGHGWNPNGPHPTVTDIVAKEIKDPQSLSPVEQKIYSELSPGEIAAAKAQIAKNGAK